MSAIQKAHDIADAIACGCTTDEIMADVEVLRGELEREG